MKRMFENDLSRHLLRFHRIRFPYTVFLFLIHIHEHLFLAFPTYLCQYHPCTGRSRDHIIVFRVTSASSLLKRATNCWFKRRSVNLSVFFLNIFKKGFVLTTCKTGKTPSISKYFFNSYFAPLPKHIIFMREWMNCLHMPLPSDTNI